MKKQLHIFKLILLSFYFITFSSYAQQQQVKKKKEVVKKVDAVKDIPVIANGLGMRSTKEVVLKENKTAKVTISFENYTKKAMQTYLPPKDMCNVCWYFIFEPDLSELMAASHTTYPGATHQVIKTIEAGKKVHFTIELMRNKDGIYIKSECGKFGCLSKPIEIPIGVKEVKLFYEHKDSGTKWTSSKNMKFTKKRWLGEMKSRAIVVKLP